MMNDASPEMLSLFGAALERTSPEERAAFVTAACGENQDLRARLEQLLRAHEAAAGMCPQGTEAAVKRAAETQSLVGTSVGPYKLVQQIGEGGMGAVYMAEQQAPV